jgi:hypothetical protein
MRTWSVDQGELLGAEHSGQLLARDRARGRGQQMGAQPFLGLATCLITHRHVQRLC